MKIYTKTGDNGETSLVGGVRILKSDARLEAYGTIDELNSFIGLLRSKTLSENDFLLEIQQNLFIVGGYLATDQSRTKLRDSFVLSEKVITTIEEKIDEMQKKLPPLDNFVIPGENELSSLSHVCRTITRRAERHIYRLNRNMNIDKNLKIYMNRLSDFFFLYARMLSK
ncbi:MAG: cob(I)yrinic acid a,c-diamide adenosyltransferase [Paludibacteraceae bacterium]|nr:cob(I)yrinic acid a,c-diamide adenosyltransferase [Paludibacteraceae bacterium]MBO7724096.1 cob(I)yrinic acid a,c-diamide adenosyltransferase [Paludibacteraceae bacterium]